MRHIITDKLGRSKFQFLLSGDKLQNKKLEMVNTSLLDYPTQIKTPSEQIKQTNSSIRSGEKNLTIKNQK